MIGTLLMNNKTRNIIGIVVSVIAILALAYIDINDNGKITNALFQINPSGFRKFYKSLLTSNNPLDRI